MSQWRVVSFPAWQGEHYVGLAELLRRLGAFGVDVEWSCFVEEMAPEPGGERLAELPPGARLGTPALTDLVAPNLQVIDGRFDGYRPGTTDLVARIRAAGGSDWDVEAADTEVLEQFAATYPGSVGPVRPEDLGAR